MCAMEKRDTNFLITQYEELDNYFKNTIIPQLFVDKDLILRKFTPPAMKQFQLKDSDVGKSIMDVKDNFRFPSILENIKSVIESNEILEKEIQTTDMRWFQMNVLPYIRQSDKKTNGVIITFVEITRRIKDLKELEKLIADYELLLDSISHDIKNPLTNIALAINHLKSLKPSDQSDFDDLLGVVERSQDKMLKLINELVESRQEEYKYKAHMELLNIEHILEDVRIALSEEIQTSGAIIKTDIQVTQLTFSRRKLRSIIYNLINNSIKYKSPERLPHISISNFRENDYVVISVKDNGRGIKQEEQSSVFLKYYRADNAEEGTGIGLYLIKEMIENAGGKIELSSKAGEGTEIKVYVKDK
jgi:two-component system, OmpR family, phosphate regulon sensor histidine kinase PhoR